MKKNPTIMIIAGEVSGDMHAARLVEAVKKRVPGARFFGIGGPEMRAAGVGTSYDVADMAVMGVTEVLKRYGFFKSVFAEMVAVARKLRPDAVILVDYPGFNLRFAAKTHELGIRTIYYICPQVWAWNRSRIPRMAEIVDRLITIFPFEAGHFAGTGLRVDFAGHPLVDEARAALEEPPADLPWKGEPRVALLPGSRPHEISRILPVAWKAAELLEKRSPGAGFIIACPSPAEEAIVREVIAGLDGGPANWDVVTNNTRQVLRQAGAAIVASGTATIEACLMGCPMAVVYKVAALTYLLGRILVRVPDIGMVNIVAGKRICPEFVQGDATPAAVADALLPLLSDTPERGTMLEKLRQAKESLGEGGAEERAAESVVAELG